ncbi:MarR family winged helix-turn-helix transcriptional regulator [Nocardia camponoti]|uniref:Transcriptional regulator n=1 Tax=Nocardia camponoti TaxID=1616106 RepID=A0A917QF84_9NOCA|nr:MarR family transcriptional regulator [Nocardia camponoti]GGK47813.1 transcriptional regulator [Nocardia camponoti]
MSESADAAFSDLVFELNLIGRHFPNTARRLPGYLLDRSAFLILTRLDLGEPLSLRELSEAFQLDISTINRQVGAMLKQDLVERVPDPAGGVARKIKATEDGRAALVADRRQRRASFGRVLADWADDDVAELSRLIRKLNQSVEQIEDNPWPRPPRES